MTKRYSLRDRKDCIWNFDTWKKLQAWVEANFDDAPFDYLDHTLDDVVRFNSFVPYVA